MELEEKQLKREVIYEGRVIHVYKDDVLLPDGSTSIREVISHRGGVCIAARKEDGSFLMVQQYRYALGRVFKEFVAGKREEGDEPLERAKAELQEETGYLAEHWEDLGAFVPTCGYDNEVIHLYYADDLTFVGQHLDDTEFLNVFTMSLENIFREINEGKIQDGKTIILAYKLKEILEK